MQKYTLNSLSKQAGNGMVSGRPHQENPFQMQITISSSLNQSQIYDSMKSTMLSNLKIVQKNCNILFLQGSMVFVL